jgi:hypothetical protein
MPMVDVSVQKELSLMEFNVLPELSIDVLAFPTLIGMELIVFVFQDILQPIINASVKVLLSEIIVKDVLQNQIQYLKMEFVNVILVLSI